MGRKTVDGSPPQRVPIQTRTTPELREKLGAAADASGRSLAQEVELRLERSIEFPSLIEMAIEQTVSLAATRFKEMSDRQDSLMRRSEAAIIEFCGGDDLVLIASRLAAIIKSVEYKNGKSIRGDEETRNAAEVALLGAIPSLFRNLPEKYSEMVARFDREPSPQDRQGLAALGTGLAPLGWTGPWPPAE